MKTKQKGIFYKDSKGWYINTLVKVDGEYKHFTKRGYQTLYEAKDDFERAKSEFILKHTKKSHYIIFNDLLNYYKENRKYKVSKSTFLNDEYLYKIYILNYFSNLTLEKAFTKDNVKKWYKWLVESENITYQTKYRAILRMKDILEFAYLHEYIDLHIKQVADRNIIQIKYDKSTKNERVIWTNDEEMRFIETTKENMKDYVMFLFFFSLGLRIGEFLALQPKCFDFKNNLVSIYQQALSIQGERQTITGNLKTKQSYRTIPFNPEYKELLLQYIKDFNLKDDDFLFYFSTKKSPMGRTTFRHRLNYYCDKANVRRVNPHAVRHSLSLKLASLCDSAEMVEIASSILGHTPTMFMNTYANHIKTEKQKQLLDKVYNK